VVKRGTTGLTCPRRGFAVAARERRRHSQKHADALLAEAKSSGFDWTRLIDLLRDWTKGDAAAHQER